MESDSDDYFNGGTGTAVKRDDNEYSISFKVSSGRDFSTLRDPAVSQYTD